MYPSKQDRLYLSTLGLFGQDLSSFSSIVYYLALIRPFRFQPSRLWLGRVMISGMSNTQSALPLSGAAAYKSAHAEFRLCRRYPFSFHFYFSAFTIFPHT